MSTVHGPGIVGIDLQAGHDGCRVQLSTNTLQIRRPSAICHTHRHRGSRLTDPQLLAQAKRFRHHGQRLAAATCPPISAPTVWDMTD